VSGQVHLGELLAFRHQPSAGIETWLASYDSAFAARVAEQAAARGETLAQFVRIAVADFLAEAEEEAWADLISAIRDAADPGARCVEKMVAFRVLLEQAT
jgi:hypothetical protein